MQEIDFNKENEKYSTSNYLVDIISKIAFKAPIFSLFVAFKN